MKTYFPFLRGKQHELMALRELAAKIAETPKVVPIIEPVNGNSTVRISIDKYIETSMPFLLVCNPSYGSFASHPERLFTNVISESLMEYENWTPALQVKRNSTRQEISAFFNRYHEHETAIIYQGLPSSHSAQALLTSGDIVHHVFLHDRVPTNYIGGIPEARRVLVHDPFHRQPRNADYPDREFFTDKNTTDGNPAGLDFGDFSIVGDHYTDTGGPARAVTVHHIHFRSEGGPLEISHFISDRTETTADTPGKVIEAVVKLVENLDELNPNDTEACQEYRDMAATEVSKGLGFLKRLAIKHHLELMLNGGIQL